MTPENKNNLVMVVGIIVVVVLALHFTGVIKLDGSGVLLRSGEMHQCVYGIYADGSYDILGTSDEKIMMKELKIHNPDNPTKDLVGIAIISFAKMDSAFEDLGVEFVLYNYYLDKITAPYYKRVYERPWVGSDQFQLDPGFSSQPPDKTGVLSGVVKEGGAYFWKVKPVAAEKTFALEDRLTPTRAYPITYNGKTGNPIIFWFDTRMAEQSYGAQISLPADGTIQTYKVTTNVQMQNDKGTLNPNATEFVNTFKISRDKWDETIDFEIKWGNPYIYK